jgi:hypothetical protein
MEILLSECAPKAPHRHRQKAFASYYAHFLFHGAPLLVDGENSFLVSLCSVNLYAIQQFAFIGFLCFEFLLFSLLSAGFLLGAARGTRELGFDPKIQFVGKILIYRPL